MRYYSSTEVGPAAGCTYRALDYWTRQRLVTPTLGGNGPGTRRRWSSADAVAVAIVAAVTEAGAGLCVNAPEVVASGAEFALGEKVPHAADGSPPRVHLTPVDAPGLLEAHRRGEVGLVVHVPTISARTLANLQGEGVLVS